MLLPFLAFAVCAAIIVVAGMRVAKYGDIIAEKTGLGGAWIGVVLVAAATSLPEFFTGISAVVWADAPDITIGNLFGANTFNLLNLALLDILYQRGPLLTAATSRGHILTAGLSVVLVSFIVASLFLSYLGVGLAIGWIGIYTPIIFLLYLGMVRMLFFYEKREQAELPQQAEVSYGDISLRKAFIYYGIAAMFIIGAGTLLAFIGVEIAEVTGWGKGFVGSLLIAFATTLPEIVVSIAAMRLGAIDMSIANMIGSNLFNMTIVGVTDLLYRPGPILAAVSPNHIFVALVMMLMTGIFIAGFMSRPQRKTPLKISWYAIAMIIVFLVGSYINFTIT
jgi:cation:H+ antiporter